MLQFLMFSVQITLPIAVIVILGILFKRIGWITESFNQVGSKLVFNVALPSLLFVNIVGAKSDNSFSWGIIGFAAGFTFIWFVVLSGLAYWVTKHRDERGVFVQGSFRGNMGIVGLAFCLSAFGVEGAALASVYLAAITLTYNILSVITLNRWAYRSQKDSAVRLALIGLIKNPLIISILLAGSLRFTGIVVPSFIIDSGKYLAQMTLPLALLCIGASLSWSGLVSSGRVGVIASLFKLIFIPYSAVFIAFLLGFRGTELGVMYLMMATPTAAASYVMVRAMGGNANLAASIIAITTVSSLLTVSIGLVFMKAFNWI